MRWPTADRRVSSPYGYRTHPITGVVKLHAGADFAYPGYGAPLYAVQDMTITEVSYNSVGGHIVKGRMPDGVIAGYFHMRERSPRKVGDIVSEGNHVGFMGSSGGSTGPHLHFETRRANGTSFDPIPYLQQGTASGGGSNPFPGDEDVPITEAEFQKIVADVFNTPVANAPNGVPITLAQFMNQTWTLQNGIYDDTPSRVWGATLPHALNCQQISAGDLLRYEPAEHADTRSKIAAGVDLDALAARIVAALPDVAEDAPAPTADEIATAVREAFRTDPLD